MSGLVVGFFFWKFQNSKAKKEAVQKMKEIIGSQVRDNLEVFETVHDAIQKGGVHHMPSPFRISAIQVFLQAGFIDRIPIDIAGVIIELYDRLLLANHFHNELLDYVIGMKSTISNSAAVKTNIQNYLKQVLPLLQVELKNLQEILAKSA